MFSDLDMLHITFKNVLSQPVVVSLNSPRARIQELTVIQFRDYERRITIQPGASHSITVHWGDKSNIKAPVTVLLQTEKPAEGQNYAPALNCFELLNYMVEYPKIDREANATYDQDTEVVQIRAHMDYAVNVNYPPAVLNIESRPNFFTIGSKNPALDLFGLKGFQSYVPVKANVSQVGDVGDPKWVSLKESPRPCLGLVKDRDGLLALAAMEADYSQQLPIQLSSYARKGYRLFIPGLAVTKAINTAGDHTSWATISLFAYDQGHLKWYLWNDENGAPYKFGEDDTWNKRNDLNLVPSGVMGVLLDTNSTGFAGVQLTLDDILGWLDSTSHVIGIVAGIVGLFA